MKKWYLKKTGEISSKPELLWKEQKPTPIEPVIKEFAKKYGNEASKNGLLNLQRILEKRQYKLSLVEVKKLISKEVEIIKQNSDKFKSRMFSDNPQNRNTILETFLNFYRSYDETNVKNLALILEREFSSRENISDLKNELVEIEKRIEQENFRKKRIELENLRSRLATKAETPSFEKIDQYTGYEFENFLTKLFSKMGYQVEQTRLSGDQGADLIVVKFGKETVIQAKRCAGKVGNRAIQEVTAAIGFYKARSGMVVTNSYFTPAAFELAEANNIELIDRDSLEELIRKFW